MRKAATALLALAVFLQASAASAEPVFTGTTYSPRQSGYLDLDWQETYLEILKLGFYVVRLGAYWDDIEKREGEYDFTRLDWQIAEAKKRNVPVVLTVGMKAPRWPEYFIPAWIEPRAGLGQEVTKDPYLRERALKFVEKVVRRYRDEDAIRWWQVENEALDRSGPRLWRIGKDFLRQEVALTRKLDSKKKRPVILTAATYPNSFLYFLARFTLDAHPIHESLSQADILGINIYPVVGQMFWGRKFYFWTRRGERAEYFSRIRRLAERRGKDVWIMELQAEPWEPGQLVHKGAERPPSGLPDPVRDSFREFRELGFKVIFLWGAEYWRFREVRHGDSLWHRMVSGLLADKPETQEK